MVVSKRGVGRTDGISESVIVHALEHRFRGRYTRTLPYYEANPLSSSQRPAPRCANTVGHYLKKRYESQGVPKGGNKHPAKILPGGVCVSFCLFVVCVALFYSTSFGESLQSLGFLVTAS